MVLSSGLATCTTWLRDRKLLTGGKTYILAIPLASDLYYKTPNTRVHDPAWVVSEN